MFVVRKRQLHSPCKVLWSKRIIFVPVRPGSLDGRSLTLPSRWPGPLHLHTLRSRSNCPEARAHAINTSESGSPTQPPSWEDEASRGVVGAALSVWHLKPGSRAQRLQWKRGLGPAALPLSAASALLSTSAHSLNPSPVPGPGLRLRVS